MAFCCFSPDRHARFSRHSPNNCSEIKRRNKKQEELKNAPQSSEVAPVENKDNLASSQHVNSSAPLSESRYEGSSSSTAATSSRRAASTGPDYSGILASAAINSCSFQASSASHWYQNDSSTVDFTGKNYWKKETSNPQSNTIPPALLTGDGIEEAERATNASSKKILPVATRGNETKFQYFDHGRSTVLPGLHYPTTRTRLVAHDRPTATTLTTQQAAASTTTTLRRTTANSSTLMTTTYVALSDDKNADGSGISATTTGTISTQRTPPDVNFLTEDRRGRIERNMQGSPFLPVPLYLTSQDPNLALSTNAFDLPLDDTLEPRTIEEMIRRAKDSSHDPNQN